MSTTCLVLGVAAPGASGAAIVTAGIAGFAAGGAVDGRRRVRLGQLALELASEVADALSRKGALKAHVRDELGLDEQRLARPFRAAWTSALSFTAGAALSLVAVAMLQQPLRIGGTVAATLIALGWLGDLGARLGGAPKRRASIRIVVWGAVAMGSPRASACSSARSPNGGGTSGG